MRKILEQENICDSLKGRVQYFVTRYRKSHDQEARIAIRLDNKEIFKSNFYDWNIKRDEAWIEIDEAKGRPSSYREFGEEMELGALNKGGLTEFSLYKAFHIYQNSSIEESLQSQNPVVRLFAILDKRVGKRKLQRLISEIEHQPEWLQEFYWLRLKADGIVENV
ncbi:MAG: hypothetical protein LBS74_08765 [Oscillospiraceae bacterium]|nr:hypothetical protein [Oscillospiraceae bacterium]